MTTQQKTFLTLVATAVVVYSAGTYILLGRTAAGGGRE